MSLVSRLGPVPGAVVGLIYGTFLLAPVFVCAQFGEGTYLPWVVSAAPLSVVFNALSTGPHSALMDLLVLASAPLVWMLMGLLVCGRGRLTRRLGFPVVVILHYVVGLFFLASKEFGHIDKALQYTPGALAGWVALYLLGHIALWYIYVLRELDIP